MPTYPAAIDDIIRRPTPDFVNTGKLRPGGASFSMGIFRDAQGAEWVGKTGCTYSFDPSEVRVNEARTAASACKEKIARDIYAFYGANVPEIALSRQQLSQPQFPCDTDEYAIHVMSRWMADFSTYEKGCRGSFFQADEEHHVLVLADGRRVRERGLGHVLAVASFINDVDVMGGAGGNIGFQIVPDTDGAVYAKTIKIDSGEAFNTDVVLAQDRRVLRIATVGDTAQIEVSFEDLPPQTQREFLRTLHDIKNTAPAMLMGFFTRRGGHPFILSFGRTVEELTAQLSQRRTQLLALYAEDLARTETDYRDYCAAEKRRHTPEAWARQQEFSAINQQLYYYVPLDVMQDAARVSLSVVLEIFLAPTEAARVLLIKGASGGGKTLSLLQLEWALLAKRRNRPTVPMPLYIELKRFSSETLWDALRLTVEEKYYGTLAEYQRENVVLLLDGFDEMARCFQGNLYEALGLSAWHQAKVIVSARSESLEVDYARYFAPMVDGCLVLNGLQQYELLSFSDAQVAMYLEKYVNRGERESAAAEYQRRIEAVPQLRELIANPFLLRIVAESLAEGTFAELLQAMQADGVINRATLYAAFMRSWFVKQERRLQETAAAPAEGALDIFGNYAKRFAFALHYHDTAEASTESAMFFHFFMDDPRTVYARNGCPLQYSIDRRCSFMHRSFFEYFVACYLLEEVQQGAGIDILPAHIVKEQAVVGFFVEMITEKPAIKKALHDHIKISKTNKEKAFAAANAITLLNAAHENLSHCDFENISIPGAELEQALCYETRFNRADLTGVNFQSAVLVKADFTRAMMKEVNFGEYPEIVLPEKPSIDFMRYSPDGAVLVIKAAEVIYIYDAHSYQLQKILKKEVCGIPRAFHPMKPWLICSLNHLVQLYDITNGTIFKVLNIGLGVSRYAMAGTTLAVCEDKDKQIQLYDIAGDVLTKKMLIRRERGCFWNIAYDRTGQFFAAGSSNEILVWDVTYADYRLLYTLPGKANDNIAFLPEQRLITSDGGKVQLWNIKNGTLIKTIVDVDANVAFDLRGQFFASYADQYLMFWDIKSGMHVKTISCTIGSMAFHPTASVLATSVKNKIQQRDATSQVRGLNKHSVRHPDYIQNIIFIQNGKRLATCFHYKVLIWDAESGIMAQHMKNIINARFWAVGQDHILISESEQLQLQNEKRERLITCEKGDWSESKYVQVSRATLDPSGQFIVGQINAKNKKDGSNQYFLILWCTQTGKQLKTFAIKKPPGFSINGRLLGFTDSHKACVYDLTAQAWIVKLEGNDELFACVLDTSSQFFAFGDGNGTVRMYDLHKETLTSFNGHTEKISALAFSPCGQKLASGSSDKTIRLWDVVGNHCFAVLHWVTGISQMTWSSNPTHFFLAAGDNTGGVCLWQINALFRCTLKWYYGAYGLALNGAYITEATGLSKEQQTLLIQHGALHAPAEIDATYVRQLLLSSSGSGAVSCIELSSALPAATKSFQLGWNCFDVAAGIARSALVDYALSHAADVRVRHLLAPEIKHAAAVTRTGATSAYALPLAMRTAVLNQLMDDYFAAHEQMIPAVAACNDALGYAEGHRQSLEQLQVFFATEMHRAAHPAVYQAFAAALAEILTPVEQRLQDWCEAEDTYRAYVQQYYGQNQWFAFQPVFAGQYSSSMVDIVARMLGIQIFIHDNSPQQGVLYHTAAYGTRVIHIAYNGINHFERIQIESSENVLSQPSVGPILQDNVQDAAQETVVKSKRVEAAPIIPTTTAPRPTQIQQQTVLDWGHWLRWCITGVFSAVMLIALVMHEWLYAILAAAVALIVAAACVAYADREPVHSAIARPGILTLWPSRRRVPAILPPPTLLMLPTVIASLTLG
jgi:WD40 repeat protein